MASSTVGAFLTTLRTNLAARPGLSGVRVDLVGSADTSADETIILVTGPIPGQQTYEAAMGRRLDSFEIPCALQTYKTGSDSDTAFQAALDRAAAILDEVIQELRDNKPAVGSVTTKALVTRTTYDPFPFEKGGWKCVSRFTVAYEAHVS